MSLSVIQCICSIILNIELKKPYINDVNGPI